MRDASTNSIYYQNLAYEVKNNWRKKKKKYISYNQMHVLSPVNETIERSKEGIKKRGKGGKKAMICVSDDASDKNQANACIDLCQAFYHFHLSTPLSHPHLHTLSLSFLWPFYLFNVSFKLRKQKMPHFTSYVTLLSVS